MFAVVLPPSEPDAVHRRPQHHERALHTLSTSGASAPVLTASNDPGRSQDASGDHGCNRERQQSTATSTSKLVRSPQQSAGRSVVSLRGDAQGSFGSKFLKPERGDVVVPFQHVRRSSLGTS